MSINLTIALSVFLSTMLLLLFTSFTEKQKMKKEKMLSFECGFNQTTSNKIPFSMNFFLITVMFLIFDIEISLIIPIIVMDNSNISMANPLNWFFLSLTMMMMMEWHMGMMNWSK